MVKCRFVLSVILLFTNIQLLTAQQKPKITAQNVIDQYLEVLGGAERWRNLKTRVENGWVVQHEPDATYVPVIPKDVTRTNFFLAPNYHLELKNSFFLKTLIMCFRPKCNWLYSEKTSSVYFFGPEPIEFENKFPRTEALEALNLKMINQVSKEDSLYRIDFKDKRQSDGVQSLYFDEKTNFLVKRTFLSNTDVFWEIVLSDYRQKDGFIEPYKIEYISSGIPYMSIVISTISYDTQLDPMMFDPPIPCKNSSSSELLESPFIFEY